MVTTKKLARLILYGRVERSSRHWWRGHRRVVSDRRWSELNTAGATWRCSNFGAYTFAGSMVWVRMLSGIAAKWGSRWTSL